MKFKLSYGENVTKFIAGYPFDGQRVYDTKNLTVKSFVDMSKVTDEALKDFAKKNPGKLEVLPDSVKVDRVLDDDSGK